MSTIKRIRANQQKQQFNVRYSKSGVSKNISVGNDGQFQKLKDWKFIHCLEIPYQIKFQLQDLIGIKLKELRLKSSYQKPKIYNCFKEEDIAAVISGIIYLKVFETQYSSYQLLGKIQKPDRLVQLTILFMVNAPPEILIYFSLWLISNNGVKVQNHSISLILPPVLTKLQVGPYLTEDSLKKLPHTLKYLKFRRKDFDRIHVRNMEMLQQNKICKNNQQQEIVEKVILREMIQ